jgi:hypothetical protein
VAPLPNLAVYENQGGTLPALPAPGSALGGPPGAPAPSQPNTFRLISQAQLHANVRTSPSYLGFDCPTRGRRVNGALRASHATGLRPAIDAAATHTDLGACEKDGQE